MEYKRRYREMDDSTKQKISSKLKNRGLSSQHKTAISAGLRNYWQSVPHKPTDEENT